VLLAAAAALPAGAAGTLLLIEAPPKADSFALGASTWVLPRYSGARSSRTLLLPGFDSYLSNGLFFSTDTGVGWNLSRVPDWQVGLRLWPQFGRRRADVPPGIDPVGDRLQAQAFANWAALPVLLLQSAASRGAGRDHRGAQLEVGATSGLPLGGDLLGIGLAATWANRSFRQTYAGITSAESAASGLPVYAPGAGWQDVNLAFSYEHRFSPGWRVSGQAIVARLVGDSAHSPLTAQRTQTLGSLTLWHDF
jgi:outer membrane scaffolding protein for murein synthesis (MipA/OmpV family)